MEIHIPENAEGSGFKVLPAGPAVIALAGMKASKGKESGKPMIIATFTVVEEIAGVEPTAIGENIVDFYSLQENAIFKIAQDYKAVTGESIPQGDYQTTEDLIAVLAPMMGSNWNAILANEVPPGQSEERTKIETKVFIGM